MQELLIQLRNRFLILILFISIFTPAISMGRDTVSDKNIKSTFSLELHPGYIFKTNPFVKGENTKNKALNEMFSAHLKYSYSINNKVYNKVFPGVYQGIGAGFFTFGDREEIGNPFAIYIFQGARLFSISNYLTFNYEWNLGLSMGWKTYNAEFNEFNKIIGSKVNAYLDVNFYFLWKLYHNLNLTTGVDFTHFSNGNTKLPNAGLNTVSLKLGLNYNFGNFNMIHNQKLDYDEYKRKSFVNFDFTLFGSYRRKVISYLGEDIASPYKYLVMGFNFATMYNVGYKFRTGVSLDGLYDASAGIHIPDPMRGEIPKIMNSDFKERLALGLSLRFEYVMPIFTIGTGIGTNIVKGNKDLKSVYQLLYLKAYYIKRSYIHIGYSLHNFDTPNYLMIGVGVNIGRKNNTL